MEEPELVLNIDFGKTGVICSLETFVHTIKTTARNSISLFTHHLTELTTISNTISTVCRMSVLILVAFELRLMEI